MSEGLRGECKCKGCNACSLYPRGKVGCYAPQARATSFLCGPCHDLIVYKRGKMEFEKTSEAGMAKQQKSNPFRDEFDVFTRRALQILESKAEDKGYRTGEDTRPGGSLYTFVEEHFGKANHPMGEVVYKVVRAHETGRLEDVEKAAAWLFLVWVRSQARDKERKIDMMKQAADSLRAERGEGRVMDAAGTTQTVGRMEPERKPVGYSATVLQFDGGNLSAEAIHAAVVEANTRLRERPHVRHGDLVRLTALVAEEAGEALKEALNYSRGDEISASYGANTYAELIQTAAMALIAATLVRERQIGGY